MATAESQSSLSYNTINLISFFYKQYTSSRLIKYIPKAYMASTQTINSSWKVSICRFSSTAKENAPHPINVLWSSEQSYSDLSMPKMFAFVTGSNVFIHFVIY